MAMFDAIKKIKEGIEANSMSIVSEGYFALTGEKLSFNESSSMTIGGHEIEKIVVYKKNFSDKSLLVNNTPEVEKVKLKEKEEPDEEMDDENSEVSTKEPKKMRFLTAADLGIPEYTKEELEAINKQNAEASAKKGAARKDIKTVYKKCEVCGKKTALFLSRKDKKTYLCSEHHNEAISKISVKRKRRESDEEGGEDE